jgi:hypothetical protein
VVDVISVTKSSHFVQGIREGDGGLGGEEEGWEAGRVEVGVYTDGEKVSSGWLVLRNGDGDEKKE